MLAPLSIALCATNQEIYERRIQPILAERLFAKVKPPVVPTPRQAEAVANPIDAFILSALDAKKLTLAPAAEKRVLLRRLYFDLLGVPPSPSEAQGFLDDKAPDAYEKLVDRLLADKRYGERWARQWLDLVRF